MGTRSNSCCSRLRNEWDLTLFSLNDSNGQTIDLKRTFAPNPTILWLLIKAFILCWSIAIIVLDVNKFSTPYYLIFLSNWGLALIVTSALLSLLVVVQLLKSNDNDHYQVANWLVKLYWAISTVTMNSSIQITVLYWILEYTGYVVSYTDAMKHGGLALLVICDGLVINRIPIRLKQILFVYIFNVVYCVWTLIHSGTDIGVPWSDNDPSTDDDAIYSVLNWNKRPGFAVVIVLVLFFIATPVVHILLWLKSFIFKPRQLERVNDTMGVVVSDAGDTRR